MDSHQAVTMKVIFNNILPVKPFIAVNIFGVLFARKDMADKLDEESVIHESIHTEQMKELLYVFFYLIYFLEWIYRLIFHTKTAYMGISFEKEAYAHEGEPEYLKTRKHYAQWRK